MVDKFKTNQQVLESYKKGQNEFLTLEMKCTVVLQAQLPPYKNSEPEIWLAAELLNRPFHIQNYKAVGPSEHINHFDRVIFDQLCELYWFSNQIWLAMTHTLSTVIGV